MSQDLIIKRKTLKAVIISTGLVVFSFLHMTPFLQPPFKLAMAVIVALLLAWPAYRLSRIMHSPYTLVMVACVLSLFLSIVFRGFEKQNLVLFGVTALIPLGILAHRNSSKILAISISGCALLFLPDLAVNLLSKFGWIIHDVDITIRSGEIIYRYGGLFRHPFVSGIISLFTFAYLLKRLPQNALLAGLIIMVGATLAIINADLGGSRRHILLIVLTAGIYVATRIGWPRVGFTAGLFMVLVIFGYEITFIGNDEGNQLRVLIWTRAVYSILANPGFGIGFNMPGTKIDTFNPEDPYLAESFFLSIGLWAGIIPMILFITAMIWPIIKSKAIRATMRDYKEIKYWAAYFALYCALVLEFLFGGILPSLFGALIIGALLGVLEPAGRKYLQRTHSRDYMGYRLVIPTTSIITISKSSTTPVNFNIP